MSIRVDDVFQLKFDQALTRMQSNFGKAPRCMLIGEFLEEMKGDLLDILVGENMRRFLLKAPSRIVASQPEPEPEFYFKTVAFLMDCRNLGLNDEQAYMLSQRIVEKVAGNRSPSETLASLEKE